MDMHFMLFTGSALAVSGLLLAHTLTQGALLKHWLFWAVLSCGFLAFSAFTASQHGLFGFVVEHAQRGFWGNQIWLDLLFMATCAWYGLLPQLREHQIAPIPALIFSLLTGSIGMMAVVALLAYKKRLRK